MKTINGENYMLLEILSATTKSRQIENIIGVWEIEMKRKGGGLLCQMSALLSPSGGVISKFMTGDRCKSLCACVKQFTKFAYSNVLVL